jgi:hypothetical protein
LLLLILGPVIESHRCHSGVAVLGFDPSFQVSISESAVEETLAARDSWPYKVGGRSNNRRGLQACPAEIRNVVNITFGQASALQDFESNILETICLGGQIS